MTEQENDNDPVGVNFSYSIEVEDPHQALLKEGGTDDFFVCRKCNKVFNNLSQYVEHKIKEESFSIGQKRSKSDPRIILPCLIQKRKSNPPNSEQRAKKAKTGDGKERTDDDQIAEGQESLKQNAAPLESDDNSYTCKQCSRTFRRKATLRWHQKYDHKSKDSSGEDSEASEAEIHGDAKASNDEDFTPEVAKNQHGHKSKEQSGFQTQEIHIVIEKPSASLEENVTKEISSEPEIVQKVPVAPHKNAYKADTTIPTGAVVKEERPFICKICGKSFKEQTVLKAHALVHSEHRSFICGVDNCPYAFKTKGGLVRHMRRHTGDRPFSCERCGRAFSESGSLTRHLKARRNCSTLTDKAYPRYKKSWTYHPNIPAVVDPEQRDPQHGRNTLGPMQAPQGKGDHLEAGNGEEIHYITAELFENPRATALSASPAVVAVSSSEASSAMAVGGWASLTAVAAGSLEASVSVTDVVEEGNTAVGDADKSMKVDAFSAESQNAEEAEMAKEVANTAEETSGESIPPQASETSKTPTPTPAAPIIPTSSPHVEESEESKRNVSSAPQLQFSLVPISKASSSLVSSGSPHQQGSVNSRATDDDNLMELRASAETESLKLTQCHVCKKDFEAVEGLEIHLRTHLADEPSRCGLCHFTAQGRDELRHHILAMHHQSLNDIEASVLAMEVEEESLRKGETVQGRQLILRSALTAVKQLYSLKKPKTSSQQEKPDLSTTGSVQCMVCNKFFRGSSYLRQHMRTHTGDRPHQCHHCNRSFTSRDILKKHMYVHQESRDYRCGECGKFFKRLGHVQQHLRSHSQEKTFRCSVCDKLFKTQHSLKVHVRTHSGINPYKCHVCNNHFRERGSLQRHMRLHTGEKPFRCHLCGRTFSEQGTLSRHLKAKVPCSANRDQPDTQSRAMTLTEASHSVLAQFSSVVAGSQQLVLPGTGHLTADAHSVEQQGEIVTGAAHEMGQQGFLVQPGQEEEAGSEYVVFQSTGDSSDIPENVVSTQVEDSVIELSATFLQEQIPGTETLQVVDSSTGESVIIVAEKAIVDLVRERYSALTAAEGGCSIARIEQILMEARGGELTSAAQLGDAGVVETSVGQGGVVETVFVEDAGVAETTSAEVAGVAEATAVEVAGMAEATAVEVTGVAEATAVEVAGVAEATAVEVAGVAEAEVAVKQEEGVDDQDSGQDIKVKLEVCVAEKVKSELPSEN